MPGFAMIFPGQGSQQVGMGHDLYATSPAARAVFDEADLAWQGSLTRLIFEGPAEELTDTANAQPALFTTSLACLAALREALGGGPGPEPSLIAGHSLGEYSALAASGAFSFAAGFALVRERGRVMRAAGQAKPGRMAAILGLDRDTVGAICQEARDRAGQPVVVANDNAPGQVVISGTIDAVQVASEIAQGRGARRVLPLQLSIAAHSPLMEPAAASFLPLLRRAEITDPRVPVIANRDACPLTSAAGIVAELGGQLTSPVRWTDTIQYMVQHGITTFIEVGPKDVLTGLLKRIAPGVTGMACGGADGVAQAAQFLRQQPSPSQ